MTPQINPYLHNNNIPGGALVPAFGSNQSGFQQFAGSQTGDRQTAAPNTNAVASVSFATSVRATPSTAALAALGTPSVKNALPEVQVAVLKTAISELETIERNKCNENCFQAKQEAAQAKQEVAQAKQEAAHQNFTANLQHLQNMGANAEVMILGGAFGVAEKLILSYNQDGLDTSTTTQEVSVAASQGVPVQDGDARRNLFADTPGDSVTPSAPSVARAPTLADPPEASIHAGPTLGVPVAARVPTTAGQPSGSDDAPTATTAASLPAEDPSGIDGLDTFDVHDNLDNCPYLDDPSDLLLVHEMFINNASLNSHDEESHIEDLEEPSPPIQELEPSSIEDHVEPSPPEKTPLRRSARLAKLRSQG